MLVSSVLKRLRQDHEFKPEIHSQTLPQNKQERDNERKESVGFLLKWLPMNSQTHHCWGRKRACF